MNFWRLAAAAGVRVSLVGAGHPYFAEHSTSVQMIDGLMVTTSMPTVTTRSLTSLSSVAPTCCLASLLMLLTLPMWLVCAAHG